MVREIVSGQKPFVKGGQINGTIPTGLIRIDLDIGRVNSSCLVCLE